MLAGILIFIVLFIFLIQQEEFQFSELGFCEDMNSAIHKVKDISINEPDSIEKNSKNQLQETAQSCSPKEAGDDISDLTEKDAVTPCPVEKNAQEVFKTESSEAKEESLKSIREEDHKIKQLETDSKDEQAEAVNEVKQNDIENSIEHSKIENRVEQSETESSVEQSETESRVEQSETESRVEQSETESRVEHSETESRVEQSETGNNTEQSEKGNNTKQSEKRNNTEQSEKGNNTEQSEKGNNTKQSETDKSEKSRTENCDKSETENFDCKPLSADPGEDVEMIDDDKENREEKSVLESSSDKDCQNQKTLVEPNTEKVEEDLVTVQSSCEVNQPSSSASDNQAASDKQAKEAIQEMGKCMSKGKEHKKGKFSDEDQDIKRKKQPKLTEYGFGNQENNDGAGKSKKRKDQGDRVYRPRPDNKDTEQYRLGYPNKKDNLKLNDNKKFYFGEIESQPNGAYIDEIHKEWSGDYNRLERHHGYIQWIFPIREDGMNSEAQALQPHEAKAINGNKAARERVMESYKMMLDFYGMKLVDEETGEIKRSPKYKERYHNLIHHTHNYLRITRILKSLGELGYEHLKKPFLMFILKEALENDRLLERTLTSCKNYWIGTIKDDEQRESLYQFIDEHDDEYS